MGRCFCCECGWRTVVWCSCVFASGFGFVVLLFSGFCGVLMLGLMFGYCWFVVIVNCLLVAWLGGLVVVNAV